VIPDIFEQRLNNLDQKIKEYMCAYEAAAQYCQDTAKSIMKQKGLSPHEFWGGLSTCLNEIATDKFNEESIKSATPRFRDNDENLDYTELIEEIKKEILSSHEYSLFIEEERKIDDLMNDTYEGIDYMLSVIYKKHKNKNLLA